ncbi:MAG: hypothetical protein AAFN93_07205 [Bacteroidota bacterium]
MEEKYLKLIDKQIEKLAAKDFDLDAWKSSASHVLSLIFGADDPKIKEIEKLKIDYSSWALRDSSSTYKPVETCKKMGREIMEMAKDEIELLGVNIQPNKHQDILKKVLSNSQYEKFNGSNDVDKMRNEVLKSLSKEKLIELVKGLL